MDKNEQGAEEHIVEEDLSKLDDSTDWKVKAQELEQKRREEGIRNRERTKALRDQLKGLQPKPEEKVENKKSDEVLLEKLEKLSLRTAGVTHPDDVELVRNTAKKWGVDIDEVVADDDFKVKLERQRTARANVEATSGVRGGGGKSDAKNTPEYWLAKATKGDDGQIRLPEETPKELYSKVLEKLAENEPSNSEKLRFYNSK